MVSASSLFMANEVEFYYSEIECDCGQEYMHIAPIGRVVERCDFCGQLLDVWTDEFLLEGTEEDVIEWIHEQ